MLKDEMFQSIMCKNLA